MFSIMKKIIKESRSCFYLHLIHSESLATSPRASSLIMAKSEYWGLKGNCWQTPWTGAVLLLSLELQEHQHFTVPGREMAQGTCQFPGIHKQYPGPNIKLTLQWNQSGEKQHKKYFPDAFSLVYQLNTIAKVVAMLVSFLFPIFYLNIN